jgi:hypothetical protein
MSRTRNPAAVGDLSPALLTVPNDDGTRGSLETLHGTSICSTWKQIEDAARCQPWLDNRAPSEAEHKLTLPMMTV